MKHAQKQVWEKIASEWFRFKTFQAPITLKFLKKQKGNVLDFGSGAGRYLVKKKGLKLYLVDFSEKMINLAKRKAKKQKIDAEFFVSDIAKTHFQSNFFDAAIAIASFHCLPKNKQKKAAKEIYRVLKPVAQAQIAVWNKNSKRFKNSLKEKYISWRDKGKRYYYLFEEKEIYKLFKDAGFKIVKKYNEGKKSVNITFVVEKPKRKT